MTANTGKAHSNSEAASVEACDASQSLDVSEQKRALEAEADASAAIINLVTFVGDSSRAGTIFVIGALIWAKTQFIGPLAVLFIAQFVLGLGTGSLGVLRSYVAEQVAPAKRTYMLARLSALQYAGFAATPLFGSALVIAGSSISKTMEFVFPGYLVVILAMVCLGLLIFKFKDFHEYYEHPPEKQFDEKNSIELIKVMDTSSNPMRDSDKHSSTSTSPDSFHDGKEQRARKLSVENDSTGTPKSPQSVVEDIKAPKLETGLEMPQIAANKKVRNRVFLLMIFLNFATRGAMSVYETRGTQIMLDQYNMPQWELGLLVSIAGVIGTIQLIYFRQFWCARFTDIQLMVGGLLLFAASQLLVINWGPARDTPQWQYVLSMFLVYAFAYPISNSAALGTFSSIQKAGKQAKAQGQFAMMGSLARVIFPIAASYLESEVEYSSAFAKENMS